MGRPHKKRYVAFNPSVCYFKPRGIPMLDLEEIRLTIDEREALRLADLEGLSHEEAGQMMGVSRATFGRIIEQARKIVADALINGKAINVEGGNYEISSTERLFSCENCEYEWHEEPGSGRPKACPSCRHSVVFRVAPE
ncbi:MAG: DUF134 domain-containing protein [Desulfobacteraceae bacterium]|jgi:predicted DNA-binding protein (UPF0251 family)|nr:DUF134 domain-containing protein [Desulfobacteraceae bacterium]